MSRSLIKRTIIFSALLFGFFPKYYATAKQHPYEVLGNEVFQSLKDQNFNQFFQNSVFSLKEQDFKKFLFNIRNQEIRNQMTEFHMVPLPDGITSAQKKWEIVFAHNWRKEWRHLATSTPSKLNRNLSIPSWQLQMSMDYNGKRLLSNLLRFFFQLHGRTGDLK